MMIAYTRKTPKKKVSEKLDNDDDIGEDEKTKKDTDNSEQAREKRKKKTSSKQKGTDEDFRSSYESKGECFYKSGYK
jgi:hypothetical protein